MNLNLLTEFVRNLHLADHFQLDPWAKITEQRGINVVRRIRSTLWGAKICPEGVAKWGPKVFSRILRAATIVKYLLFGSPSAEVSFVITNTLFGWLCFFTYSLATISLSACTIIQTLSDENTVKAICESNPRLELYHKQVKCILCYWFSTSLVLNNFIFVFRPRASTAVSPTCWWCCARTHWQVKS